MTFPRQLDDKLFYHIARSHMYWSRKHTNGLSKIFKDLGLNKGDVFLDPFCGGGSAIIAALSLGTRVLASDINPMAVFITKVLIQPINIIALHEAFEKVKDYVADRILENYTIVCPNCRKKTYFDFLKWNNKESNDTPEAAKINCLHCGFSQLTPLSNYEIRKQFDLANIKPAFWFPKNTIHSQRKTNLKYFHEFFTLRNLASLAALHYAIEKVSSDHYKEILHYVFTGMLYSCSLMQMFSNDEPSSSRGWTAPRFYLPPVRQEKNVWKAFEARFRTVLNCKNKLNAILDFVQVSDSLKKFEDSDDTAYIHKADFLRFPFPRNLQATHVFLDPPYKDDIDFLGFSEFWGSWLKMNFDFQSGWNPGALSDEENAEKLRKILLRIKNNTDPSCIVTLAFGATRDWMRDVVSEVGYNLQELNPILYDNSLKRGQRRDQERSNFPSIGHYFLLKRTHLKSKKRSPDFSEEHLNELKLYIRVVSFLIDSTNPEKVRERADKLIPPHLQPLLSTIKQSEFIKWTKNQKLNRNAYHRLCLTFIDLILSKDNFNVVSAVASQFDKSELLNYCSIKSLPEPLGLSEDADFEVKDNKGRNLIFCFYDKKDKKREMIFKRISKRIRKNDIYKFENICFLIIPSHFEMNEYRQVDRADHWQRGFFVSFDELATKAKMIDKKRFGHLELSSNNNANSAFDKKIGIFNAKVLENTPVGKGGLSQHFKIKFEAKELQAVVPGQFVMINTQKKSKKKVIFQSTILKSFSNISHPSSKITDQISYLKRPFSIHRAFYKYFEEGYIKNILLPHNFATIAHTVFPHRFDIFYRVIEDGIGTKELKSLKKDDTIEMLGPLGRGTKLADLRLNGIKEVHLIGGGVGMAPLVFFGQGLRYYSFKIKAFIGIQNYNTLLLSKKPLDSGFADEPKNSYVYYNDLLNIGLKENDIYISHETKESSHGLRPKLPKKNYHHGFVSEQYESYLRTLTERNKIIVIACGPTPMMKALLEITMKFEVQMKVLMEKRMGCGIGVCMSCICPTKKNNQEEYTRVCVDGPLFDAQDIDWEKYEIA